MDAYLGYNNINMHATDQEYTSFIIEQGLFYYKVMLFGLKNAGATYQMIVTKMFASQIWKNMKVYVDDMLVKICTIEKHRENLFKAFQVMRSHGMKLNLTKCAI